MHSNLMSFARWFLEQPFGALRSPHNAISHYVLQANRQEGCAVTGVVLHREGFYQVELFSIIPTPHGVCFPEHAHPHVDSFEYLIGGAVVFTIAGNRVVKNGQVPRSQLLRVRRNVPHGACAEAGGGSFLSIQRWYGITPSSVGLDWAGPEHLARSTA